MMTGLSDHTLECTYVSARTIRVRLVFSIVNLVFPSWPAILPKKIYEWCLRDKFLLSRYRLLLRDDRRARFLHLLSRMSQDIGRLNVREL